jgi:hypothetical protein
MALKMNKEFFFDEELEEIEYEKLEALLDSEIMESLRNLYDAGWDEPNKLSVGIMN